MIRWTTGNLFEANTEAIVNAVNCVGVMGRGIALQFKRTYPDNFAAYSAACKKEEVKPGRMFVFETGQANHPKWIINFPTKRHWRSKSRIEDIELGLTALAKDIEELGIQSIAIPPLGCGLGGLDWLDVRAFIEQELSALEDVEVVVFEPGGIAVARDRLDKDVASN